MGTSKMIDNEIICSRQKGEQSRYFLKRYAPKFTGTKRKACGMTIKSAVEVIMEVRCGPGVPVAPADAL
jgi:hypothetical protein